MKGPQEYLPVDAVAAATPEFGPGERAAWVKKSIDICEKKGVLAAGYIPKAYQTNCLANLKWLFAYHQYAKTGFELTCRMSNGSGSGWSGVTGAKQLSKVDVAELTETAANKAVKSQKPRAIEPGRYTTILEPRPAARLLSTMIGAFNAGAPAADSGPRRRRWRGRVQLRRHRAAVRERRMHSEDGHKLFSDSFMLKNYIGNRVLRQTPIMNDGQPARPVTWIEKGAPKNVYYDAATARRQKVRPPRPTPT